MLVSGWKTGTPNIKTGGGFGIRIKERDRDKYFDPKWISVEIDIVDFRLIEVSLSGNFWKKCPELRSKWIGKWMIDKGIAPWSYYNPPVLKLEPVRERYFKLSIPQG